MNEVKETKAKESEVEVGTNVLTLPWPSDPQGALAELKKGGIVAARRVNGDKEKLGRMLKTLGILKKHAVARYEADVAARKESKENAVSARIRVKDKIARQAEARAKEYEEAAARIRKQAEFTKGKQ